jgi:hypothetical protein
MMFSAEPEGGARKPALPTGNPGMTKQRAKRLQSSSAVAARPRDPSATGEWLLAESERVEQASAGDVDYDPRRVAIAVRVRRARSGLMPDSGAPSDPQAR